MIDGGRKANTAKEIDDAKSRLRMRDFVRVPNRRREGLGLTKAQYAQSNTKRDLMKTMTGTIR